MTETDNNAADLDALLESATSYVRHVVAIANVTASAAQSDRFPPGEDDMTATAGAIAEIGRQAIATLERAMRVARKIEPADGENSE